MFFDFTFTLTASNVRFFVDIREPRTATLAGFFALLLPTRGCTTRTVTQAVRVNRPVRANSSYG